MSAGSLDVLSLELFAALKSVDCKTEGQIKDICLNLQKNNVIGILNSYQFALRLWNWWHVKEL